MAKHLANQFIQLASSNDRIHTFAQTLFETKPKSMSRLLQALIDQASGNLSTIQIKAISDQLCDTIANIKAQESNDAFADEDEDEQMLDIPDVDEGGIDDEDDAKAEDVADTTDGKKAVHARRMMSIMDLEDDAEEDLDNLLDVCSQGTNSLPPQASLDDDLQSLTPGGNKFSMKAAQKAQKDITPIKLLELSSSEEEDIQLEHSPTKAAQKVRKDIAPIKLLESEDEEEDIQPAHSPTKSIQNA
ncbi:hypothetical protein J3R30DRAFT_3723936 [Lentinula aciculospora]|uniref:Uncharacterized protein n=1 Tax=Lentinula aciculospora TaxID=153920 RepID=A0A9W8ZS29_9AGAR|nr:hypothetical protein J3R30DRAFT_3723936 [Lentinula aciculospora]